ncbi:MAG: TetR/AcrR family transcriptional regulator [Sphingomonadales bacterium]|nr:TetR/AcrR family transcriptional regulator [Sphingomonadales bacterium]MBU3991973.1 TetR/AcrR family transcriptional regulator [Alphaproteobacteria bacterium]
MVAVKKVETRRRTRANGERTRQRLLSSAVSLWSEHGQLGLTVSAVAEHAGTTRRTVYHHFATQEILQEEAQRFVFEQLAELASGNTSEIPDPYGFVAGLAVDNPELVRSILLGLMRDDPNENPIFARSCAFYRDAAEKGMLCEGIPTTHAASITLAMWFAAILCVSLEQDPAKRRAQADSFAVTFETMLHKGILTTPFNVGD